MIQEHITGVVLRRHKLDCTGSSGTARHLKLFLREIDF